MFDFVDARRKMVDCQLRPVDVTNLDILATMRDLPRERFVPAAKVAMAYLDSDVPVVESGGRPLRSLLRPEVLARLIQAAQVGSADRVLAVGCATGYSAAVLSRLAKEVVALEEDAGLARQAREALAGVDAANVTVVSGPLTAGWPTAAPYDVVFVDGAIETEPTALLDQLGEGGRLIAIVGRGGAGRATLYRIDRGEVSPVQVFNAAAPVLPGFEKLPEFVF